MAEAVVVACEPVHMMPYPHDFDVLDIDGIPLHRVSMDEAVEAARRAILRRQRLIFGMANIAKLVHARTNELLQASLRESDVVLADGMPVVWLSRLRGKPVPERVAGIDLMYRLMELASEERFRVFLLGASEEINAEVARRMAEQYPGCQLAGRRNGYFAASDEVEVAAAVRNSEADILFVAMSPPKKEQFLNRWAAMMRVPVCHGVGGSFDVFAGRTSRAPRWMQRCGLEWFYRVLQEPRRMWKRYLVTNLLAIRLVGVALRGRMKPNRPWAKRSAR